MIESPNFIVAQLNDAAKKMATDGSTTYFEQVATRAKTINRTEDRGRCIVIAPMEPDGKPLCIDTSLRTVTYINKTNHHSIRVATSATIPRKTAEAINHYFIDYLERVLPKLK